MSKTAWAWTRLLGGAALLVVIVWRVGSGPVVDGVRAVTGWSLVAAAAIAAVTTVGSAWRWRIVARGLGVGLPVAAAITAYYRSQFLNTALPGGVLGDVHRAVSHGRDAGDVGRGLRAVTWERCAGQVVQGLLALIVLVALPSPLRSAMRSALPFVVVGALALVVVLRALPHAGSSRPARVLRAARADLHDGLLARRAWPGVTIASLVVVAGHTATFLIAARVAGSTASTLRLLPLAMVVLLAMAVPLNIGGWGPREGAAAGLFALAGLGADRGVATATAYGVLVFVASLPGAVVLAVAWWQRRETSLPVAARPKEPAHG
jgi:uncharacterized membrane protein YbhN (UPF0104 family)